MLKVSKIVLLFIFITAMSSCGGLSDAGKVLRNEKIKTTDEFLVKKREPLSLPPDFKSIPEPGSIKKNKQNNENNINRILKIPQETKPSVSQGSSIEKSIINQIRK